MRSIRRCFIMAPVPFWRFSVRRGRSRSRSRPGALYTLSAKARYDAGRR